MIKNTNPEKGKNRGCGCNGTCRCGDGCNCKTERRCGSACTCQR